ncbi:MAG: SH3 domain-containing protein [Clostridia bacterium]|nr:SH3 domain-containing protein [Clostridia bacterium]
MSRTVKILSFLLCFTLVITVFSVSSTKAFAVEDGTQGYVIGEGVNMREGPNTSSALVTQLSKVNIVIHEAVSGQPVNEGYDTWYRVSTLDGSSTGYVYGIYIKIYSSQDLTADFEKQLESFPESYREPLRILKRFYPNWTFIADPVTISFNTAVDQQYAVPNRKQVHMTYKNGDIAWRDPRSFNGTEWATDNGNWVSASRAAIAYYMDPRNFLNPNDVYMFMQQGYDPNTQNETVLRQIVKGTFLENGYDGDADAYIKDIMEAAATSGVSPYILASTIIIEQGTKGTSRLISGNVENYQGYYNFFNFGASGTDDNAVVTSGLNYAVSQGWNSRKASIIGGANKYNSGYISRGQDTYYYKDFNLADLDFDHQYAQNVYDAYVNSIRLRKVYIDNTEVALTFKIPVFTEIPAEIAPMPGTAGSGASGSETSPIYRMGDTNGDNVVNALDLAAVKKHILKITTIEGFGLRSADVNSDGAINALDLALIKKHILGIQKIS